MHNTHRQAVAETILNNDFLSMSKKRFSTIVMDDVRW